MTLNARKSCADSFLKIKSDDNGATFSRNQQSSEKFDSEMSLLQPVNVSEKHRDIVGVHQRAADSFQRLQSLFLLSCIIFSVRSGMLETNKIRVVVL